MDNLEKTEPCGLTIKCNPQNRIEIYFGDRFVYYNNPMEDNNPVFKIDATPDIDETLIDIVSLRTEEGYKKIILEFDKDIDDYTYIFEGSYAIHRKIIKKIVGTNLRNEKFTFGKSNIKSIEIEFYKNTICLIRFSAKLNMNDLESFDLFLNETGDGYSLTRYRPVIRTDPVVDIFIRNGLIEIILENEIVSVNLDMESEIRRFIEDVLMTEGAFDILHYRKN